MMTLKMMRRMIAIVLAMMLVISVTGKEDFAGESTEDFSEYDYSVGLISDDLILINVMVKDHPSVRSQLYGFQD